MMNVDEVNVGGCRHRALQRGWKDRTSRIANARAAQSLILYGLRGVGKTVLLRRIRLDAEDEGYVPVAMATMTEEERETLRDGLDTSAILESDD